LSRQTPSPLRIVSSRDKVAAEPAAAEAIVQPAYASLTPEALAQSLGRMAEALQAAERTSGTETAAASTESTEKRSTVAVSSLASLSSGKKKAGSPVGGLTVKRETAEGPGAAPASAPKALPRRGRGDVPS
jgi:hypothetical protein